MEINKIYNCDCIELMENMKKESVNLIITDPPYGINYHSNGRLDKKRKIENDDVIDYKTFGKLAYRVLKPNSHAYFFTRFDVYPEHYRQLTEAGFKIKSVLVADKLQVGGMGDLKGSFTNNMEWVIFAHKGRRIFNETTLIKNVKKPGVKLSRYANPTGEYKKRFPMLWKVSDGYPPCTENSAKNKDNPHPTPKNPEFLEWLIQLSSNEGEIIFDPFSGSGSTMVACINTNRMYIGCEIDKEYWDYSQNRIQNII